MIDQYPALLERWDDLNEAIDEGSLGDLAAQIAEEPDGPWLALQGLGAVEPEVRAEIIAGLAEQGEGPGVVEFLRLLAFAHEPATRWAALDALEERPDDDPDVADTWRAIALAHPDPGIVERASSHLAQGGPALPALREPPKLVRSLVTAVDGEGRATIVLAARDGERWTGAAFLCHGLAGVVDVAGQEGIGDEGLHEAFAALHERTDIDAIEGVAQLARGLLAGSLSLSGPRTTPALRYWVERVAGRDFKAAPGLGLVLGDWDPFEVRLDEMAARARDVLLACPPLGRLVGDLRRSGPRGRAPRDRPARPETRFRRLSLPVRAPAGRADRALPADAPLDGRLLARGGTGRPRSLGAGARLAAHRPAACRTEPPVLRRAHDDELRSGSARLVTASVAARYQRTVRSMLSR